MSNFRVARRYAQAVMELADEQKQLNRVAEDFEILQRAINESREFIAFLKSPVIKKERKTEIFAALFRTRVSKITMSFLDLLVEKSREDALKQIVEQFFALRDDKLGIVNVDVRAAVDFSKDQHQAIEQRFATMTKKKVRVSFSLDKQLKGGFIARIGDTVYDGSIRRQLELLRERFAEGADQN